MKQISAIAAILLASLATAGSASAQDHSAKAKIPFGFYVDNKWVPAGTYSLIAESKSPEVIEIRNSDSSVALLDVGRSEDKHPGPSVLVFAKYGDKYFLHEIRCAECHMDVAFSTTKREKQARTEQASVEAPSTVYLALK